MDKKSKEALRRYKKSRQQAQSTSDSSSSSESSGSSSFSSSSDSGKAAERHRKKKARQAAAGSSRRSSSSSGDERRKREKREHCQKKLEAKRNHLKRKLKEAKLKKRAAAAAAALSGHSHRALSPATQAKLKKLAERKRARAISKEGREREREKHRAAARERERDHHRVGASRSPTKITKIRIHQDVKRQKSPPRVHQLMTREKIIIQTRTRDRTPSAERERQRHEHKLRHDEMTRERERRDRERERADREAARDKERAEALARCQERQRERERLAREKMRREEEDKKYGGNGGGSGSFANTNERGERLLPRPADREIAIATARGFNSRERSLEAAPPRHVSKRDLDVYEREREYLEAERLDREELRREREYLVARRRDLSPVGEHYVAPRMRDHRDLYPDEDRERCYGRPYLEDARHPPRERESWIDPRELRDRELHDVRGGGDPREIREHELLYPEERISRERTLAGRGEWKNDWSDANRGEREWGEREPVQPSMGRGGFVGGPKRGGGVVGITAGGGPSKIPPREQRAPSEPDWDADEVQETSGGGSSGNKPGTPNSQRDGPGGFSGPRDLLPPQREKGTPPGSGVGGRAEHVERRWQPEWRDGDEPPTRPPLHHHRSERGGGRGGGFRRGGLDHGERTAQGGSHFRPHPPPLMTLPVQPPGGFHGSNPRFPGKRNMTYTNPNLIKKQQAALAAAKAAAHANANASAQASAVAAATTAVAAAKAAAQSSANATTNPGILGQVRLHGISSAAEEKPEAGEIVADSSDSVASKSDVEAMGKSSGEAASGALAGGDEKGELSEISDSDDDILNKTEKKAKPEAEDSAVEPMLKVLSSAGVKNSSALNEDSRTTDDKLDDEEMLDFEEISDGELEEDARNKGVGDALGVDWASLIAETKRQADVAAVPTVCEQPTTAKQKWQPHRVILDIGISMRMAGEAYAKRLLADSQQKLDEELKEVETPIKTEIKCEMTSTADEDSQTIMDTMDDHATVTTTATTNDPEENKSTTQKVLEDVAAFDVDRLHPLACIQVGQRLGQLKRLKLIASACGVNSRALSARQDLKLRRQLCGLPARECDFPRPLAVSNKLKARALAAFQRTLEVK